MKLVSSTANVSADYVRREIESLEMRLSKARKQYWILRARESSQHGKPPLVAGSRHGDTPPD